MLLGYISDGWAAVVVLLGLAVLILGAMVIDNNAERRKRGRVGSP